MPMTLEAIIAHVRSQGRQGTHQAALLRRIDELEGEVANLREAIEHQTAMLALAEGKMPLLSEAQVDAYLAQVLPCGQ